MRNLLLAATAIAAVALAPAANALPVFIGYDIGGGIIDFPAGPGVSYADGSASATSFVIGTYTISLSAEGTPPFTEPNFGSNTLTVKSIGPGTINLYASETGITNHPAAITSGFTNNPISDTPVTETTYVGLNTKYDLTDQLASSLLAPGVTTQFTTALPGGLPATYSNTERYTITFGLGGGVVNATILEIGRVPEPASLALLGVGLLGLGFVAKRKRSV